MTNNVCQYQIGTCGFATYYTKATGYLIAFCTFERIMQQVTIMDFIFKTLVFFGTVTIGSTDAETSGVCATPQYLNLGIIGTIQCSFRENFYGVYWYSSTDSANTYPLLTFQESEKGGDGYLSGEFDVFPNGSLVIKNVSLADDHIFRVILLDSKDVDSVIHDIRVYVIVRSKQPHPYINRCGEEPVCLVELQEPPAVECSVAGTRPAVNLTWTVQHETTYWKVPYESEISSHDNLFTTNVKMTVSFENSYLIQHFVCTAVDPPGILAGTESHLFLENANERVSLGNPVAEHVKHGTKLTLSCLVKGSMFVIWKRLSNEKWETLAHTVFGEKVYLKTYADDYLLDKSGSLVIPHAVISHEGLYMCVFSTSRNNSVKIIDVVVFVPPEPPSVIIVGCLQDESCVLTVQEEGNITCTVRGVRPKIKLGWFTFLDEFSEYVSFSTQEEITEKVGDKYDVTLTSQYKLRDVPQKSLAVECRASGWDKSISNLDKTVVLHFIDDQTPKEHGSELIAIFVVIPLALLIVIVLLALVITHRRKNARKNSKDKVDTEELRELNPKDEPHTQETIEKTTDRPNEDLAKLNQKAQETHDKTTDNETNFKDVKDVSKTDDCTSKDLQKVFEEVLKSKYKELYTVQQLPCLSEEKRPVNEFFTNRELEMYISENGGTGEWKHLESYGEIFKNAFTGSTRLVILKGEPNTGKSTLSLQMAHDWCKAGEEQYIKDYEIFILLQFRDLQGVTSIFEAIKNLLKPNSNLAKEHIEEILGKYTTGLLVFDGLEEFPEAIEKKDTGIFDIITGNVFKKFHLIIITSLNSSRTLNQIKSTHIRLPYYDRRDQSNYIRQNVRNYNFPGDTAERNFERNPFLGKICSIPMLFACYVDITVRTGEAAASVTDLLDSIISPRLGGLFKKNEDVASLEEMKKALAMAAFKKSRLKEEEHFWSESEFCSVLKETMFNYYTKTGLLVIDNKVSKGKPSASHTGDNVLRFRHRLFFDWFVAQHICNLNDEKVKAILKELDPNEHYHVFCFICGMNANYFEQVIETLKYEKACKRELPLMCFFELSTELQTGFCVQNTKRKFEHVFSDSVTFSKQDDKFYQMSVLQLEDVVAQLERGIKELTIKDCMNCAACSQEFLRLENGFQVPTLKHLEKLNITLGGHVMDGKQQQSILQYAASCKKLSEIRFSSCFFESGKIEVPDEVLNRQAPDKTFETIILKVKWTDKSFPPMTLNLQTGNWVEQDGRKEIPPEEFEKLKKRFQEKYKTCDSIGMNTSASKNEQN